MTSPQPRSSRAIRPTPAKVVVAVNPPAEYAQALDAAARLAARLETELEALLVEDPGWLEIARMPVTRLIDSSGRDSNLDDRALQCAWRVERRRLEEALRRCTAGLDIRAKLRTVQGHFGTEAMLVASKVDVTLLTHCRSLADEQPWSQRDLLRAQPGPRTAVAASRPRPVWVIFDGSAASQRALTLGAQLASDYRSALLVLHTEPAETVREQVLAVTGKLDPPATLVPVSGSVPEVLAALKRPEGCALVLAPREGLDARSVSQVLEVLAAGAHPLILVA